MPRSGARRGIGWRRPGENLRMARVAAQNVLHSFACFHAQQTAEFALKALVFAVKREASDSLLARTVATGRLPSAKT
ncbi:MAG: HEPN domain-containing protein [Candidatus Coatesbacteria bacterium]|nr:HEPN domain-containing protein [Candidatus Coatesbacteria bacterium]